MTETQELEQDKTATEEIKLPSEEPVQTDNTEAKAEDVNWKKFREERERERKEKQEAIRHAEQSAAEAKALREAMEAANSVAKPRTETYNSFNYDDEESEKELQARIDAAMEKKEREREEKRRLEEQKNLPNKLKSVYGDFNQVCNEENLDYLEYHYPGIAAGYKHMPEGFDKWSAIYETVKKLVPSKNQKENLKKIEENKAKPKSMSAGGATASSEVPPIVLDEKRRQENWNRMQRIIKGH